MTDRTFTTGRLICLEGCDAAGKTTLASRLAGELTAAGAPAVPVFKKGVDYDEPQLAERMTSLRRLLFEYPRDAPIAEWGDAHWFHMMVSWFVVLDRCRVQPLIRQGHWVVVDNWYYKFMARFLLKPDVSEHWVRQGFSEVSVPDDVLLLDLDPALAMGRVESHSPGEDGAFDRDGAGAGGFLPYQRRVLGQLRQLGRELGWITIDATGRSPEDLARIAAGALLPASPAPGVVAELNT